MSPAAAPHGTTFCPSAAPARACCSAASKSPAMAEALNPCCQVARQRYIKRVTETVASYPLIKDIPCPTCRRIIQIRLYVPPGAVEESA